MQVTAYERALTVAESFDDSMYVELLKEGKQYSDDNGLRVGICNGTNDVCSVGAILLSKCVKQSYLYFPNPIEAVDCLGGLLASWIAIINANDDDVFS